MNRNIHTRETEYSKTVIISGIMGRIRNCAFLRIFTYKDDEFSSVRLGYVRVNESPTALAN